MIPLVMIVSRELRDGSSKVALADRNDPIQTFLFNRSHEAFRVGVRIRRLVRGLHDTEAGVGPFTMRGAYGRLGKTLAAFRSAENQEA